MLNPIRFQLMDAGYCTHPQTLVLRNGNLKPIVFHAMFAVLVHPREGVILFDTGYSRRFLEVTRRFPEKLYALTTPVHLHPKDCAVEKLARLGIGERDVRHVVISHFHADHVAALADFPEATYWFHEAAWESVRHLNRWNALFKGFLPQLVPDDFEARSRPIIACEAKPFPPEFHPFAQGFDLFGDRTVLAVELPGHAAGHLGAFVATDKGRRVFLAADACWTSQSYREHIVPHPVTKLLFADYAAYQQTLGDLRALSEAVPDLLIAPSHCPEIHAKFCNRGPF